RLVEEIGARVFRVQALQLAQNLFRTLVLNPWNDDLDLYDLIAALAFARCAGDALLAHAQLLSSLRSGRDLELCASGLMAFAVNRRDLDACAKRGLHRGDRDRDVNVVRNAAKQLVMPDANDEVKVAGGRPFGARIAHAGEADPLPVARAGLDAKFKRLVTRSDARAVARGTSVLHLAAAAAPWALDVELHASAGLLHLAGA